MKFILPLILTFSAFASTPRLLTLEESTTIVFNDSFNPLFVAQKQIELMQKATVGKDLYLYLETPGGSVPDGASFIDLANGISLGMGIRIHTVTNFAASMGYITSQNLLGKRYILPSGTLMSHRAKIGGIEGQLPGEANTRLKYYADFVDRLSRGAAERVGISYKKYMNDIQDELWLVGEDAVKSNHADEVVNVVCGKSLTGLVDKVVDTPFGKVTAVFSKCPLISQPIEIKTLNGQEVTKEIKQFMNRPISTKVGGL